MSFPFPLPSFQVSSVESALQVSTEIPEFREHLANRVPATTTPTWRTLSPAAGWQGSAWSVCTTRRGPTASSANRVTLDRPSIRPAGVSLPGSPGRVDWGLGTWQQSEVLRACAGITWGQGWDMNRPIPRLYLRPTEQNFPESALGPSSSNVFNVAVWEPLRQKRARGWVYNIKKEGVAEVFRRY